MIKKIVVVILLVFFIGTGVSKTEIIYSYRANKQFVFLIFNSRDIYGTNVFNNVHYTLLKNGIETISWDLNKNENLPPLQQYPIVGIVTEQLYNLKKGTATTLIDYVNNGGTYIQFIRGYSSELAPIFSIDPKFEPVDVNMIGIRFFQDFFPGCLEIGLSSSDFCDDGLNFAFSSSIKPIAVSLSNIPLLWETSFGRGKTLFWNCTALNTKAFRGFIIASVTRYLEISVRKVIGKSVMFIDDFPASSWRAKLEPTYSELGITDTGFYSKVLLNDLINLSYDFYVKYSTVAVFNYNNVKEQPYTFGDWDNCVEEENGIKINIPEKMFSTLLSKPDIFEVGLHGYNHVPLTQIEWIQEYFIQGALASAREKWIVYSKKLPTFYVAPMNEIDETGLHALTTIFPEITTICTLYESTTEIGCNREFSIEPWDFRLVDVPRLTSGYYLSSYDRFLAYSTLEAFGIWSHFIHPDDIFSNPVNYPTLPIEWIRNPNNFSWYGLNTGKNGLYYKFKAELEKMENTFPWIEYDFVSSIRTNVYNYSIDDSYPLVTDNKIIFQNSNPQRYLIELPENYSLENNDNLKIVWSELINNKKVLLVESKNALSVSILPWS